MTIEVVNDASASRYGLIVDGERIGELEYDIRRNMIILFHTEVDTGKRRAGWGGQFVREVLDQVRANTPYRVVAACPFVSNWIEDNPEYADLLER